MVILSTVNWKCLWKNGYFLYKTVCTYHNFLFLYYSTLKKIKSLNIATDKRFKCLSLKTHKKSSLVAQAELLLSLLYNISSELSTISNP